MILAIDIGNTTTNFGVFEGSKLKSQFSIATPAMARAVRGSEVALQLKALAKTRPSVFGLGILAEESRAKARDKLPLSRVQQIMICSVVPRMTSVLVESLKSLAAEPARQGGRSPERSRGIPIRIVGQDVQVPLKNRYRYPEQVGQDRLVGAYAAWHLYRKECIVADFGTAITIDLVTGKGEYLGGIIAPGLEISLDALASRTALLPKVELKEPPELLGRDTANSIRSGVLHGCVALTDGLVTQLKRRYAPRAVVVGTGGASPLIAKHSTVINHLKPHLVLEGLYQIYYKK